MNIAPPGHYHPADRCAWCGARYGLVDTVVRHTRARGKRCRDSVACIRRQARQRRVRLYGKSAA